MIQKYDFVELTQASSGHPIGAIAQVREVVSIFLFVLFLGKKHHELINAKKVKRISVSKGEMEEGHRYALIEAWQGYPAGAVFVYQCATITPFAGDFLDADNRWFVLPYTLIRKYEPKEVEKGKNNGTD